MSDTANQVIRNLLKSADASWLEGGGHDWKQAVEEAESHLRKSELAAPIGSEARRQEPSAKRKWIVVCMEAKEGESWYELQRRVESSMGSMIHEAGNQPLEKPWWTLGGDGIVWLGEGGRPSIDDLAPIVERGVPQNAELSEQPPKNL